MTKETKDNLFILVKSLTKSEKRQFKLYVGRLGVNSESKYLNLFNHLDKAKSYNESNIVKKGIVSKQQLANVKAHLYKQILVSLKLNPLHQNIRSQIRNQLDFASILYHKGLYKQSLKILDKAKEMAMSNEEKNMAFEIVELEKVIESQYITRSISSRAEELVGEAKDLSELNVIASRLSNLSLELYSKILKTGYVKNEEESAQLIVFFNDRMPDLEFCRLGFRERLWLFKTFLWYNFLMQDFLNCFKYASKWVDLFYDNPQMINLNPVFFLKGNNYLLESIFFVKNKNKFIESLNKFKAVTSHPSFVKDENVTTLIFLYTNIHNINQYFIDGTFDEGLAIIPKIEKELLLFDDRIDPHHKMIFYYKFAILNFGSGNNKACISYLEKIITNKTLSMREDLLCFSRILNFIAHYEAGLDFHLESLLKSTYKFLIKMNDLHEVQKEIIKFIRGLQGSYPYELKGKFKELLITLKRYENHPFERRSFLYLDIISWLECKIDNKPIGQVIREKSVSTET
ncbi:hypothetical protein SCB49_05290 [unidentified eubacterium SCB49]|nr:hypothetical protein SCB49_05290 [unidentified eubacterium SCB49]